jgi:hypothetical protein
LSGGVFDPAIPAIYGDLLISRFAFLAFASGIAAIFKDLYEGVNRIVQRKTRRPICSVSSSRPPPVVGIAKSVRDAIVEVGSIALFGVIGASYSGKGRFEVPGRRHLL